MRPAGPGWEPVARRNPEIRPTERLGPLALSWLLGVTLVYATLFGVGYLVVGRPTQGLIALVVAVGCAIALWFGLARTVEAPEAG